MESSFDQAVCYDASVIRIRHILDPDLKQRVIEALAERRGMPAAAIPEWYELDDADYVDLLNDLKMRDQPEDEQYHHDSRM